MSSVKRHDIFTDVEQATLNKTQALRSILAEKSMANEKLISSAVGVAAVTGLLDSMDKAIHTHVKLSIDKANSDSAAEHKNAIVAVAMNLHANRTKRQRPNAEQAPEYTPREIAVVSGELTLGEDVFDAQEIINRE